MGGNGSRLLFASTSTHAENWDEVLLRSLSDNRSWGRKLCFALMQPSPSRRSAIYEAFEERKVKYVIHMPANDSLERDIAELLTRPMLPSHKPVVLVQGLSLSGRDLEHGVTGGGEGRVSCLGAIPENSVESDSGDAGAGGGAVL